MNTRTLLKRGGTYISFQVSFLSVVMTIFHGIISNISTVVIQQFLGLKYSKGWQVLVNRRNGTSNRQRWIISLCNETSLMKVAEQLRYNNSTAFLD